MLGFSQNAEKRQAKAEAERAEHAFDAARTLPLEMQQDVARRALTECTGTFDALSKNVKERESLYRLRNAALEQQIQSLMADSHTDDFEPAAIPAVLAQTLLAASSGARRNQEYLAQKILQWAQTILPDFARFHTQLAH